MKLGEINEYAKGVAGEDNYACGLVRVNGVERMFVFKLPKDPNEKSFTDIGVQLWQVFK